MRKFVFRASVFGLLIVGFLGGWSAFLLHLELATYAREAKMPPDAAYAVCGDSQTAVGLLPELWPGFFNFSISDIRLDQMELKTIDLLERNPGRTKVLLIDITPRKLVIQDVDVPLKDMRNAGKRFLLHVLHPRESRRSLEGLAVIFRDAILVKRTMKFLKALRKHQRYRSSIGGAGSIAGLTESEVATNRLALLAKPDKMGFRDHRDSVFSAIGEHADEMSAWGPVTLESKTVACITNMIAIARRQGVTPVLMTTPWHRELLSRVSAAQIGNHRQVMREIARRDGNLPYLDYLEMPFDDGEWYDGNHLNRHGAVRLTERVRQDVERLCPPIWK